MNFKRGLLKSIINEIFNRTWNGDYETFKDAVEYFTNDTRSVKVLYSSKELSEIKKLNKLDMNEIEKVVTETLKGSTVKNVKSDKVGTIIAAYKGNVMETGNHPYRFKVKLSDGSVTDWNMAGCNFIKRNEKPEVPKPETDMELLHKKLDAALVLLNKLEAIVCGDKK